MIEWEPRLGPVAAKLIHPRSEQAWLRPETLAFMERGCQRRLTLVCAPAGYGKTTTVAAALQRLQIESVWYKLDVLDHDPVVFIASLVEAFRRHLPDFGQAILERLRYAHESPVSLEQLASIFVVECAERVNTDMQVVIDDYHEAADSPDLNRALDCLLANSPEHLRFIVLSRYDPAFSTGKMRVAGEVSVLGVELLRFDAEQAGLVLEARAGRRFDQEHVERLIHLTEGWPASVVLAGLALDWLDLDSLEQALADPRMKQDIYSYLAEQVYRNEGRPTQRFLDRTCFLEHVTETLANRLVGIDDAHRHLHHLTTNRVFTFADEPGAYRYHNLFREYLRHNYVHEHGETALRTLQRESAAALESSGNTEMAVELLFNANDQPSALEALARAGEPGLDNFRTESLISWLQRLSWEMRADEPWARLLSSQIHVRAGDLDAALVDIDAAISTCESASDEWGLYHALSAKECVLFWRGDLEEAVTTCEAALSHASSGAQRLHSYLSMGSASLDRRDWVTARTAFAAAEELSQHASTAELARAQALRAHADYFRGDYQRALSESPAVDWGSIAPTLASGILNTKGLVETGLANYAAALAHFDEAQAIAERFGLALTTAILTANAGVAIGGQGHTESGLATVRQAVALGRASEADPVLIAYAMSDEGTIHRRCGQHGEALALYRRAESLVSLRRDPSLTLTLAANLIFTIALAGEGDADGLPEIAEAARAAGLDYVSLAADKRPEHCRQVFGRCLPQQLRLGHADLLAQELSPRPTTAMLALRALAEPQRQAALLSALARHWRFAGVFESLAEEDSPLLGEALTAAVRCGEDSVLHEVLVLAGSLRSVHFDAAIELAVERRGEHLHPPAPRVLDLTKREHEVLSLMAQGLRNPEIAERLFLSNATVKTHVNHVFAKLEVDTRVQAILKYREFEPTDHEELSARPRQFNPSISGNPA